jgi:hypothetical protein
MKKIVIVGKIIDGVMIIKTVLIGLVCLSLTSSIGQSQICSSLDGISYQCEDIPMDRFIPNPEPNVFTVEDVPNPCQEKEAEIARLKEVIRILLGDGR